MTGLPKSFQVVDSRRDGADPASGAVSGVEIATGDADEPEPVGPSAKSLALASRESRAVDLDGTQTLVGQYLELGFPEIMGRMCQRGHAARSSDQADRALAIEPQLVNASGAAVSQVPGEHLACTGHLARSHQVIAKVTSPQYRPGEHTANGVKIDRESESSAGAQPWPRFAGLDHCEAMPWRCKVQDRRPG